MNDIFSLRMGCFLAVFLTLAITEIFLPRRRLQTSKTIRWFSNLGIVAVNSFLVYLLLPLAPAGAALLAEEMGWGLFKLSLGLPFWMQVVLGVLFLDLIIYIQHVLFHALPGLWRLHMVHHADLDFDLTTGLRFHPLEIMISALIKMGTVILIGANLITVIIFEILLNATSIFNHGNVRLPFKLDKVLRMLVVTPDMHRVHHSVIIRETNSNFGFNLPWWDRLLGTYKAQPQKGHENMSIGIAQFRNPQHNHLLRMLALPFTGDPGRQPLNRH